MKVGRFGLGFKSIFHMTGTEFTRQLFSWNVNHQLHGNLHQLTGNNSSGFMNGKILCFSFDLSHTFFLSYVVVCLVELRVRVREAMWRNMEIKINFLSYTELFAKKRKEKKIFLFWWCNNYVEAKRGVPVSSIITAKRFSFFSLSLPAYFNFVHLQIYPAFLVVSD